ncbi:MAG: hypothetical protein ABIS01_08370, partial [Ferruginibacter sp.]
MKNEEATVAVNYKRLKVSSTAFAENELLPAKFTCDGINTSPPLDIDNIPADSKCLVLIVDDPDASAITMYIFNCHESSNWQ